MTTKGLNLQGRKVVVVQCGSFNPPHYLHLRLMEMARDFLRMRGAEVVCGVLSPVSDKYTKQGLLSAEHRLEMCRLAVAGSDWIGVDAWEASQSSYTTTKKVLDHIAAEHAPGIDPILVCGADLLESFNTPGVWDPAEMAAILSVRGVVCIEREGIDTKRLVADSPVLAPHTSNIFLVPPTVSNNVSSTAIRRCAHDGMSLRYLLPDLVIDYILKHAFY